MKVKKVSVLWFFFLAVFIFFGFQEKSVISAKEALIIIDMSNDFVADKGSLTAGAPAQKIVPYIIEQADAALKNGNLVVISMDNHQANDPSFQVWPKHNVVGTWGIELYGDLANWYGKNKANPNVLYSAKTQYDAFFNTNLATELKKEGIDTVILTGVCTDICVFLSCAGANFNGFKTVVLDKGTATFTQNQQTFLNQMNLIFQTVVK